MADKNQDDLYEQLVSPPPDKIITVPISELHPFPNHPYKVNRDDALSELAASIKEFGVVTPALVRPRKVGGYEIISGHRRKAACALVDVFEMPVIVRNLDDDAAIIAMTEPICKEKICCPAKRLLRIKCGWRRLTASRDSLQKTRDELSQIHSVNAQPKL
jgi:ParB family chromosome partitioning protein